MEAPIENMDCISKYDILQEYCGFNDGLLVKEDHTTLSEKTSCVRLGLMGKSSGLEVKADMPYSKVMFKINAMTHSEVVSDNEGFATFNFENPVDYSRIHCAQVMSNANILEYSVKR